VLDAIRIFIKVAECGSFSKAATVLAMSPSSVSRQVDKLERHLSTLLFRRSTRRLTLTDGGSEFLERARQALADLDAALSAARPDPDELAGTLRVSVFESFGHSHVCPALPGFLARHPKIGIELAIDNRVVDLYRDDVNLAIRIGRPADSRLKARKLLDNHMRLCAAPAYLSRHAAPLQPADLAQHNCLTLGGGKREARWHFRRGAKKAEVSVSGNLASAGGTPLLAAALQGTGLVLLPDWMVSAPLRAGALVEVMPEWQPALHAAGSGGIYAVFIDDPKTLPLVRALIEHLLASVNDPD